MHLISRKIWIGEISTKNFTAQSVFSNPNFQFLNFFTYQILLNSDDSDLTIPFLQRLEYCHRLDFSHYITFFFTKLPSQWKRWFHVISHSLCSLQVHASGINGLNLAKIDFRDLWVCAEDCLPGWVHFTLTCK